MISAKRVDIVRIKMVKESSLTYSKRVIRSPEDSYQILKHYIENLDREHFVVLCLDTKNQPTHLSTVHIGTLNASLIHPREVMKPVILSNAASFIVAHNHPSGVTTPSQEDINVTKRLVEVGEIMGIECLDHIIIGDGEYWSLKERGYM